MDSAGRHRPTGPFRKGSHFALFSPLPFRRISRLAGDERDAGDDGDVDGVRQNSDD